MEQQWKAALWTAVVLVAGALAQPAAGQKVAPEYEIGALGLISDYRSVGVTNGAGQTGSVGPGLGVSGGFVLGQHMSNRWGGEFRYLYSRNELQLTSGSQSASFNSQAHLIHYDVLYYFADPDSRFRPYVAGGGGLKRYQGVGTEDPFQPLSNLALLTKTSENKPMGDFGVGVKFRVTRHAIIRVEFRDYITGVPKEVIAAAPGAKINGGLLHQWAPIFGISWTWQ